MDGNSNYTSRPSQEYVSREIDSYAAAIFNATPRFTVHPFPMFDAAWANSELIPFLQRAYSGRPGISDNHDWWADLRQAEWNEPKNMPNSSVEDPIFIERLRLALISPDSIPSRSLVANVARDVELTVRLLIRRYVMHGGEFRLASLPDSLWPEMADEVLMANMADDIVTGMFTEGWNDDKQR